MKVPDTSFRARQLDLCLEMRTNFLTYYVKDRELSLPERMKECDFIDTLALVGWEDTELKDISLLEHLPNVESISFCGIQTVEDFNPLRKLPKLKKLSIQNSLCDLDIIEKLPPLAALHLSNFSGEMLIDCKKLVTQTKLKALSLCCLEYYNEEYLKNLTNLKSLSLRRNMPLENSKSLDFLRQFPNLECLSIEVIVYSGYSDVNAIRALKHLKHLHIKGYEAALASNDWLTPEWLDSLPALDKLHLEDCQLSEEEDFE
jgi:Leucine-rich repeat (LRR) protein